jgi:hypothetical protein
MQTADRTWRRSIAGAAAVVLAVGSLLALRWIWRDITYWSRSATVDYRTGTLEDCVALVLPGLPGITLSAAGPEIRLSVPGQEGVLVKDDPAGKIARIVVYGHSGSVSHLGPDSEEPVAALLGELSRKFASVCSDR